jgi:hypothetical protein
MSWKIISKTEIDSWNEKLKLTNAVFYQYPYFVSAEYSSMFSKSVLIKYVENDVELAYAAIVEIGYSPFKFAIIECGPVLLHENADHTILLRTMIDFCTARNYMQLQIRPFDIVFENLMKKDKLFENELLFPFHQQEEFDWNIYAKPEDELLKGFKIQCRRKIVLAGRVPYKFCKLQDEKELKHVHILFKKVASEKGYKYMAFRVFENLFKNGKKYDLCDIYAAYLNGKIVNAVFIVKDAKSFYHLSSGMVIEGYNYNESPPAKLHYFLMQDCFYNERKEYYNISFGGSDNLIRFKELFNPVELEKPPYYTYIINRKKVNFFKKFNPEQTLKLRTFFKKMSKIITNS